MPQYRTHNATNKRTNSEDDWAWVLHELANGKDPKKLTRSLASRCADDPVPFSTLGGRSISHPPDFGLSKVSGWTTLPRCL
jgi:hypothetical protein